MSYAIIRNEKYNRTSLNGIYRHNERKNTSYTNKNINHKNTYKNYAIKKCDMSYLKKFDQIRQENNLKGWIKKNSNIICEYVITSDNEYFKNIGEKETRRFFETAYKFVKNYKNLGEKYILSANVHLDEATPHMHLIFIPVVHSFDKKSGKVIDKICCSEFWKGKDSYKILQDNFHKYMIKSGFDLERGNNEKNEHIPIENLKKVTNYEIQKILKNTSCLEQEKNSNDIEIIKNDYKRVIKKFNTIAKRYSRIKNIVEATIYKAEQIQKENYTLKQENKELQEEIMLFKDYIDKTFEYVSLLFDFSKEKLKRLVDKFICSFNKEK